MCGFQYIIHQFPQIPCSFALQMIQLFSLKNILIGLISFGLYSCANISTLSGGPRDLTPPQITKLEPAQKSLHFNTSSILLEFDEYIRLNNPNIQITFSPPLEQPATYTLKGKEVSIEWEGSLLPNTTYSIDFGQAIKDYTEGNVLKGFQYVFSTGAYIDSLQVQGQLIQVIDGLPAQEQTMLLYRDSLASFTAGNPPQYITLSDEKGLFTFNHLKAGTYYLFSLDDKNSNKKHDLEEAIGYAQHKVVVTDSVTPILFRNYTPSIAATRIDNIKLIDSNQVNIRYNGFVKSEAIELTIADVPTNQIRIHAPNASKGEVTLWSKNALSEESIFITALNDSISDTFSFLAPVTITIPSLRVNGPAIHNPHTPYTISFNQPIPSATNTWQLQATTSDSQRTISNVQATPTDSSYTTWTIATAWNNNTDYLLQIPRQSIQPFTHYIHDDTLQQIFKTNNRDDYSNLIVSFEALKEAPLPCTSLAVELRKGNQIVAIQSIDTKQSKPLELIFEKLSPSDYQIKVFTDCNQNNQLDAGNLKQKTQPEYALGIESVSLRLGWDAAYSWK